MLDIGERGEGFRFCLSRCDDPGLGHHTTRSLAYERSTDLDLDSNAIG